MASERDGQKPEDHVVAGRAPSDDDAVLLSRVASGERDLVAVLLERHQGALRRRLKGVGCAGADAEDILQLVAEKIINHAGSYGGTTRDALPWLAQIAINAWLSTLRVQRRLAPIRSEGEPEDSRGVDVTTLASDDADPEARLAEKDLFALIARLLADTDPTIMEVIWPLWREGKTYNEVAAELNTSPSDISNRMTRMLRIVREHRHLLTAFALIFPFFRSYEAEADALHLRPAEKGPSTSGGHPVRLRTISRSMLAGGMAVVIGAFTLSLLAPAIMSRHSSRSTAAVGSDGAGDGRRVDASKTRRELAARSSSGRQDGTSGTDSSLPSAMADGSGRQASERVFAPSERPETAEALWSRLMSRNVFWYYAYNYTPPIPDDWAVEMHPTTDSDGLVTFEPTGHGAGLGRQPSVYVEAPTRCRAGRNERDVVIECSRVIRHPELNRVELQETLIGRLLESGRVVANLWRVEGSIVRAVKAVAIGASQTFQTCTPGRWWSDLDPIAVTTHVCERHPTLGICERPRFRAVVLSAISPALQGSSSSRPWIYVRIDSARGWRGHIELTHVAPVGRPTVLQRCESDGNAPLVECGPEVAPDDRPPLANFDSPEAFLFLESPLAGQYEPAQAQTLAVEPWGVRSLECR